MKSWQWNLPVVLTLLGLLVGSTALAEDMGYVFTTDFQQAADETPFQEEPVSPAMPDETEPPPPAATPDSVEPPGELPSPDVPGPDAGEARLSDVMAPDGCGSCLASDYDSPACSRAGCRKCSDPCGSKGFTAGGITLGGWIDQGITANSRLGADRFNGPVTFNDRDGEWQVNQIWVYAEKKADTGGHGWGLGGRVDFLYGTDRRFTQALGLEDDWNAERFYGAALPQVYADVAYNDLTVRMGHFFTIVGYEVVAAPDNFFYSHAYTMQYGEPFTHTGLLGTYALSDRLSISAGFGRGWDNWEDNNHHQSFLGGVTGTCNDGATTLAFAISTGPYDDAGALDRTMYSVVLTHRFGDHLRYVLQHDLGVDNQGDVAHDSTRNAEWYGINQYLLYELNACWSFGMRFEWFRDDDGVRVGGLGAPNGWTLGPDPGQNQVGWAGNFYELTLGFNWRPFGDVTVRPECRWDWYAGPANGAGQLPYNFGNSADQFTFATDLIITF